nr:MAG: non-structural polyprotein [Jingmen bat omegatetravirus 1]
MYAKNPDVARVYNAAEVSYANTLQQRAIKLDFAPPLQAYETLQRLYFPLRFKPGTGLSTQHPVLAGHQRVAEEYLHGFARSHSSVLEIGPSLQSATKLYGSTGAPLCSYHGCTKASTRDNSRHIAALQSHMLRSSKPEFKADAALLAAGVPSETFCVDGVGACAFKAQVAISNHSLYDVTLEELANGFDNHGLHVVKAFMHMPEELLYMDEVVNVELGYRFKVVDEPLRLKDCLPSQQDIYIDKLVNSSGPTRRTVLFSGDNDWADAYVHDYHTWIAYLLVRHFPTPFGFSLHIEVQKRHGSSIELRITRTEPGDRIVAIVPRTSSLCRVPNVFQHVDATGREKATILTSLHKVNMLLNFMQTRPERELLDFTTLMAFARARLRAIVVATEISESSWNISPADLIRVVASLYVLHLIERRRAAVATRIAKEDVFQEKSLWEEIKDTLKSCCGFGVNVAGRLFSPEVIDKYSVHNLSDILCDVQLTPEEVGFLPGRIPPARVLYDREELEALREAGVYNPHADVPTAPPVEELDGSHTELWDAACASLAEYKAQLAAGLTTDIKSLRITLENAIAALEGLKLEPVKNLELYDGPPGSGKTGTLIAAAEASKEKVLYIAPTKELRAAMDSRINPPSMCATQHVALTILRRATAEGNPFRMVVVDECFMYPLVYIAVIQALSPSSRIILVGDVNQIGFIDFTGLVSGIPLVSDVVKSCRRRTFNVTKRCPADVVATPFFQSIYPGCTTTSSCVASISYVPCDFRKTNAQVLCFTQEEKSRCGSEGAITVHEAQGRTYASVILHYNGSTSEQKLLAENAHLLVGITRHTNHLYVRDASGDIERKLSHSAKVELFMGVEAPLEISTVQPRETASRSEPSAPMPPQAAIPAGAISILRKAFGDQPECGCVALAKTGYEVFGGNAKINIELAEPDSAPKPHYAFQEGVQWVKVTSASNKHQALQTLLARYTKRSKNLPLQEAEEDVTRMLHSLDKHWDWTVTEDALARAVFDTQARFTQRGHTLDDLCEPDDPYIRDIDFLMKTQQKVSTKPMNSGKVGQGIAAHSKSLNFVLAAWVRILEEILRTGSDSVRYSNGLPDEEEAMLLEAKVNRVSQATFVSADWTEFDTAHNNTSELLFARLLERIGTPAPAVALFRERCGRRVLRAKGVGSVIVENLLDSGAVWTLCRNTIFSAAVMLTLFRGVKFAAFKGDDSLLCGSGKLTFTPSRLHMGEHYQKKHLKVEVQKVVPYIGLLVSAEQVVSDPIRCALKVFGRCYTSERLYHKYVEAVRDLTHTWVDARRHSLLQHVASKYYNLAPECAAYVIDAVLRFGRGDFAYASLTRVRAHAQAPDAYSITYPAKLRDTGLEHVFEPRLAPPPVGNVLSCVKKVTSSSPTAATGASAAATSQCATGLALPASPWDVPAANNSLASLTPATPSTSSSRSSSSPSRASSFGKSLSGGNIVRTQGEQTNLSPPSRARRSPSSECLRDARTGSSLTARTALHRSSSSLQIAPLTTEPSVASVASPSVTPSCATAQVAEETTSAIAHREVSQFAHAAVTPYRPPTSVNWKPPKPFCEHGAPSLRTTKEDPAIAEVVKQLIRGRYRPKTRNSSRRSSAFSETEPCIPLCSTSTLALPAATAPATLTPSGLALEAAETEI